MKVGVIGAGTMGNGIAQVFAQYDHEVILCDRSGEALERAKQTMENSLKRIYGKQGKTEQDIADTLARISFTLDIETLRDRELVVEAVAEKMDVKLEVFRKLDAICPEETLLATNTSGLSVTEIAASTGRPDKVIGTHFFNPPPIMKLVEVVTGEETSEETVKAIREICGSVGKETIQTVDSPLFIVNRILIPMLNEAMFVYQEGLATKEDIDKGMKLGTSQPIGPLALADLIGLDTLLLVCETLLEETGDSKYRVPQVLRKKVRAGHLGRKSGRGFYEYEPVKEKQASLT
ncbi:3-hydroxybutyryl-CoA dehydrogenase [Bhargavaea cecembensis]|uniref:3-hydroxybutyryl-CoA dehydrogenase n=1 Tax=Bhargavaea cecembensis TaxID=394098 RepID=A0A161SMA2_9BACL|nr:3-hydroxyacyl-CoA dehydrogenase NAD-binding domain-containing protein [Bhargavaea cecembensis]KZE38963.1 3-hydroxybutyryl-CoA dehydrogenase [Bhargavaea cecembensis]